MNLKITLLLILFSLGAFQLQAQTIVIDPGHGYCNDCTQSCTSNIRSDSEILTAMAVGDKLNALLQNCSTTTSYLTRTTSNCGDFPSLSQRAIMSNNWNADRFLSIHCNAGGGNGTETFWCDNSISSNAECQTFATEVQNEMVIFGVWNDRRVVEDNSYLGFHLGVLHPTNAVGTLSEIAYVDNPANLTKLLDDGWRDQFALGYLTALQNDLGFTCVFPTLDCSSAINLTCGVIYSGASSADPSNVETYGCNNWTEAGPERVHTITPTSNGILTASLSNYTGDLDVYILGSCDPTDCLGTVGSDSATIDAKAGQTYYIVVDADDGSGSAYDIVITCPTQEDITLNATSTNITNVEAGRDIDVSCTQNYSGTSIINVPNVYASYYLSIDCTLDGTDILLSDQDFSSINNSNPNNNLNRTVTIPIGTIPGNYNILFLTDATGVINESDENNNLDCIAITVEATTLDCSNAITLSCGVTYSGGASTDPSFIETYGCNTWTESGPERVHTITPTSNGILTASLSNYTGDLDVYILGSCDPTDCLGTVGSDSATIDAKAGQTYYIVVDADDGSGSAYDIVITCPTQEDITLSGTSISNAIVNAGENVNATCTQNYSGTSNINVPNSYVHFYLSIDCILDGSDVLLDNQDFSTLHAGNTADIINRTITIPINTIPGNYNILYVSDASNVINESDENNNITCTPVMIDAVLSITDLETNPEDKISVYPNPTNGEVFINTKGLTIKTINCYSLNGKLLKTTYHKETKMIDLTHLENGIYILQLIDFENNIKTVRVLKQ